MPSYLVKLTPRARSSELTRRMSSTRQPRTVYPGRVTSGTAVWRRRTGFGLHDEPEQVAGLARYLHGRQVLAPLAPAQQTQRLAVVVPSQPGNYHSPAQPVQMRSG